MKHIGVILFIILFNPLAFSQTATHTAPTLQVGLDGLSFGKGMLDSELIIEIIAEKQNEIKLKVAQNLMLTALNDCGGTMYSFGDNVLRAVIEEKDQTIRKRKILESLVNTLFSVTFVEYYLKKEKESAVNSAFEFLKTNIKIPYGMPSQETDSTLTQKISVINSSLINAKGEKAKDKLLAKGLDILAKNTSETNLNKAKGQMNQILFYSVLLDIATEAIKNNKTLTQLGIFNVSYSKTFEYQSNYKNFDFKKIENMSSLSSDFEKQFKYNTDTIYKYMSKDLENISEIIGALNHLTEDNNFRIIKNEIKSSLLSTTNEPLEGINFDYELDLLKQLSTTYLNKEQSKKINTAYVYLKKINEFYNNTENFSKYSTYSDIAYTLKNDIIPSFENFERSSPTLIDLIDSLNIKSKLTVNSVYNKNKALIDELLTEENISLFTNLASKLYQFDKGSTYIQYFNLISEISDYFEKDPNFRNDEVKEKLSYFNTFVKDYVVFNSNQEGQEYIDFNVESFLNHLSEMKANKSGRFNFVFDVGVSTGWFINPYTIDENINIRNISFISEKLGLRYKFYNPGFWQPKSPGDTYSIYGTNMIKTGPPKEPIINNVYGLIYGSGILYNIFDTSTENTFDNPFLGIGGGIGFFNSLDVSITAAIPLVPEIKFTDSFQYAVFGINLDIRFNEYIQRLGEKRRAAQTQKVLANASQSIK